MMPSFGNFSSTSRRWDIEIESFEHVVHHFFGTGWTPDPERRLAPAGPASQEDIRHRKDVIRVQVSKKNLIHLLLPNTGFGQPDDGGSSAVENNFSPPASTRMDGPYLWVSAGGPPPEPRTTIFKAASGADGGDVCPATGKEMTSRTNNAPMCSFMLDQYSEAWPSSLAASSSPPPETFSTTPTGFVGAGRVYPKRARPANDSPWCLPARTAQPFPTLYPHRAPARRDAIARARPTVEHQGIERPVRIGAHLNSAVPADQNRHFLAVFPAIERFQGGVHQTLGLFSELHLVLIAIPGKVRSLLGWYPETSGRLKCYLAGHLYVAGRVYSPRL